MVGGARATDEEGELYWRMTQFMLPSHGTGPATVPGGTVTVLVPIDDHSWMYCYAWIRTRPSQAELEKFVEGHGIIAKTPDYMPVRNRSNV